MKLGDHPEFEKLGSNKGNGSDGHHGNSSEVSGPMNIPDELIFDTFYNDDGTLKQDLFFGAPQKLAKGFERRDLNANQFRAVYRGVESFASPLRDGRMSFPQAVERFGSFYAERIVRQNNRGHLPDAAKEFIDRHRDLILSDKREMLGFAKYLKNTYCYFDPNK